MSIDMYLSDSKKQASSVSTMCKSQVEGYEDLQKAINDFVLNSMQLKGKTYDSAKTYFSGVLLPLSKGGMLLSEAVEKAVKKFPEDYVAQVDSCSLKESKLEEQIQQADTAITRINAIRESISKLDSKDFNTTVMLVTNSAVLGIYNQIKQDLTEKLEKLRLFNATSPTIFSEIASLTEAINQGIAQTKTAFNASTGTFTMPSQENMAWARTINDYEQKQIEEKDKELLKGCTIIKAYDKSQNFEHYMLEKDGHCYYIDEKELSGTLKELASKYGMTVLEISPKELTARVNDYQKSGRDYFSGKKFPIKGVGALSHVQDRVENLKESGIWDAMLMVGFTVAAVRNAQTFNKVTSKTITTNKVSETNKVITDGSHLTNGKLKPNSKYTTGEFDYHYETDTLGRVNSFQADDLKLTNRANRLKHNPNTPGKLQGDHAGHLAGDRFGGSPDIDNLISQSSKVNQSAYKKIENQWAKAISEGKQVSVDVKVNYDSTGLRPISFDIDYTIDGKWYNKYIDN